MTHAQYRRASASACRSHLVEIYVSSRKNFTALTLAGLLSWEGFILRTAHQRFTMGISAVREDGNKRHVEVY